MGRYTDTAGVVRPPSIEADTVRTLAKRLAMLALLADRAVEAQAQAAADLRLDLQLGASTRPPRVLVTLRGDSRVGSVVELVDDGVRCLCECPHGPDHTRRVERTFDPALATAPEVSLQVDTWLGEIVRFISDVVARDLAQGVA